MHQGWSFEVAYQRLRVDEPPRFEEWGSLWRKVVSKHATIAGTGHHHAIGIDAEIICKFLDQAIYKGNVIVARGPRAGVAERELVTAIVTRTPCISLTYLVVIFYIRNIPTLVVTLRVIIHTLWVYRYPLILATEVNPPLAEAGVPVAMEVEEQGIFLRGIIVLGDIHIISPFRLPKIDVLIENVILFGLPDHIACMLITARSLGCWLNRTEGE